MTGVAPYTFRHSHTGYFTCVALEHFLTSGVCLVGTGCLE